MFYIVLRCIWYRQKRGGDLPLQVGDFPPKAIRFCTPEFPEISKRYASSAYFVPFLNSPLQEIIK